MKKIIPVFALLLLFSVTQGTAQDVVVVESVGHMSMEERAKMIKDRLDLSENQFIQMKMLFKEEEKKMPKFDTLDLEDIDMEEVLKFQKKADKVTAETHKALEKLFTPAQMTEYNKMKEEERAQMMKNAEEMQGGGHPVAPPKH